MAMATAYPTTVYPRATTVQYNEVEQFKSWLATAEPMTEAGLLASIRSRVPHTTVQEARARLSAQGLTVHRI